MIHRLIISVVGFTFILSACGDTDPLGDVENCTELRVIVAEQTAELVDNGRALTEFADQVQDVGQAMANDAIARGAELEAILCANAMSAAVPGVFGSLEEILTD